VNTTGHTSGPQFGQDSDLAPKLNAFRDCGYLAVWGVHNNNGGSDGTSASCVTGRRSNQLNYAPALKTDSLGLPRTPLAACPFLKRPENAATNPVVTD
jgi:hypothetical protein